MEALSILASFIPLGVILLLGWAVARAVSGRDRTQHGDPAVSIRRFFLYGLLFVSLIVATQGLTDLFQEVLEPTARRSNADLARSLSFTIVGIPAAVLLVRHVDRRLRADEGERNSVAWMVYLVAMLATSCIVTMVNVHVWIEAILVGENRTFGGSTFDGDSFSAALLWGGLWAGHWFGMRRRHGVPGDLDLATGTVLGMAAGAVGVGGVIWVAADEFYNALADDPVTYREGPTLAAWIATAVVGGVVWWFYWMSNYRTAPRTQLWYVTVVPIGALTGFVTFVTMLATIINIAAVWLFGEPSSTEALRHFDLVPSAFAALLVGAASWLYHRSLLSGEQTRNDVIRSYDYLVSAAALVTSVIGATFVLTTVFAGPGSDVANPIIAGVTMLFVGGPLWALFWSRIQGYVEANQEEELQSPLRRVYVFAIFGISGLTAIISLLVVLSATIEAALDGVFSSETLHDNRVGIALLIAVSGVVWYHFKVFSAERHLYVAPPPPPPGPEDRHRQLIVVTSLEADLPPGIDDLPGVSVVHWHQAGDTEQVEADLDTMPTFIAERSDYNDLLIVCNETGASLVPLDKAENHEFAG